MKAKIYVMGILFFLFRGTIVYAETLHFVTEDYPPLNMRVNEQPIGNPDDPVTGIGTDIVRQLMKHAGIEYTIRIYPKERAHAMARETPGYGLFSIFRSPEREQLFQWVGPLVPGNWVMIAKKSRNIRLSSLEDAKKYKIGTVKSSPIGAFLEKNGHKIDYSVHNHLNVRKLDAGTIDFWATADITGMYAAKREGISDLEQVFLIRQDSWFIAFNKSVSPDLIVKLNKILHKMRDNGAVEKISDRYR